MFQTSQKSPMSQKSGDIHEKLKPNPLALIVLPCHSAAAWAAFSFVFFKPVIFL
jgi:hypothetical protein